MTDFEKLKQALTEIGVKFEQEQSSEGARILLPYEMSDTFRFVFDFSPEGKYEDLGQVFNENLY